jgi:Na+/H+ antiporter NhaC
MSHVEMLPTDRDRSTRRTRILAVVPVAALLLVGLATFALAQGQAATQPAATQPAAATVAPQLPDAFYGAWVLVPPVVTIVLAIALRQVIPALSVGVLIAAGMMTACAGPVDVYGGGIIGGLRRALEGYLLGALHDLDHLKILVFTMMIGGMVGIIAANGGTQALVDRVSRWASNRQRGQIATWFAGLIVFFDDYANAMIVGPAMRPICDRLRISRAKLAYIVDSTAAPVSSIALIGTWVGTEIGYIDDGLKDLVTKPAFLTDVTAYGAFLNSIPFRFYAILAIVMVALIGWLDRDFGAMRRAERKAHAGAARGEREDMPAGAVGRAWYAVVPVLVLVVATITLLGVTGWYRIKATQPELIAGGGTSFEVVRGVISNANSYDSLLYGSLAALVLAGAISLVTRMLTLSKVVDSATDTVARMVPTFMVLVLAWSLSGAMKELMLGEVAKNLLNQYGFNAIWLPFLIFVSSCVVSFATGTSWGTMGILCPATVIIAAHLLADYPRAEALPIFYAAVGAVLSGAVFGDHCSPISDTTVLSSLASSCSLEQHVWTQIPYALTVALVSTLCGDVLCRYLNQPWWVGLLTGTMALWLIVLAVGRKPQSAGG